jgi:hypothetical protein
MAEASANPIIEEVSIETLLHLLPSTYQQNKSCY